MNITELDDRTIDGYTFEWDSENSFYQCRGEVEYDNEHDPIPEAGLWKAAKELEKDLTAEGFNAYLEQGEKGWVEICIES